MKVRSESEVAQLCLTLSNPIDCSLPGSSIHGIFQARVLEWGAIAFSEAVREFFVFVFVFTKGNEKSWNSDKLRNDMIILVFLNTTLDLLLGWPRSSLKFFHKMLQKNPNELLANPIDISGPPNLIFYCFYYFWIIRLKTQQLFLSS